MHVNYFQCYRPWNLLFVVRCVTYISNLRKIGQKLRSLSRTMCTSERRRDRQTDGQTDIHSSDFISVQCHPLHWTDNKFPLWLMTRTSVLENLGFGSQLLWKWLSWIFLRRLNVIAEKFSANTGIGKKARSVAAEFSHRCTRELKLSQMKPQIFRVNGMISVSCSVPEGPVLGPVLFISYAGDVSVPTTCRHIWLCLVADYCVMAMVLPYSGAFLSSWFIDLVINSLLMSRVYRRKDLSCISQYRCYN